MLSTCVPWVVAEAIALVIASVDATTVRIVGDASGRVKRICLDAHDDEHPVAIVDTGPADLVVWITESQCPTPVARLGVLDVVNDGIGYVVMAENVEPGMGLGIDLLRRIDPGLGRFETDEVPGEEGRTRQRSPWEAPARWVVAHAASWRFEPNGEAARAGLRARLHQASATEMVAMCRRLMLRFEHAHEILALAAEELSRRGDFSGLQEVCDATAFIPTAPRGIEQRIRRARIACLEPMESAPRRMESGS